MLVKGAEFLGETCESCGKKGKVGEKNCRSCDAVLGLACPGCQGRMKLSKVLRVELDVCQDCDAIWFDDGELSKVSRRYQRRKRRKGGEKIADDSKPIPLNTLQCTKCKKEGLRHRDVYKTPDGPVCRSCMPSKGGGDGHGLSGGMMNDGGSMGSNVVDAMVTLTVVDAILDLFSD
jgi:Zn-finger nucleic acid-binding protein